MPTSIVSITFLVGLALMVLALLGGGIKVKEIEIPKLPIVPRILSFFTGCAFLALLFLRPDIFQVFSDKISPPNPPPIVNPSPPPREIVPNPSPPSPPGPTTLKPSEISKPPLENAAREEQDEVESLKSAKFNDALLRTLARDAKTPKVQAEAGRRLDVIATEQKSYEAVKNDIAGLKEFVAKPCEACLVQDNARGQLQNLTAAAAANEPKPDSSLIGYVTFAVIDKNNNIKKQYLNIDGKPGKKFPGPSDIVIAIDKEPYIWAIPYHWDINSGAIAHPSGKLTQIKIGQKAKVGSDVFISSDPNGDSYAIVPISSLIDTNNPQAQSLFKPIITSPKILGYVYNGQVDNNENKYNFINQTRQDAIYPAANDTLIATTDIWLHAGPRYWDATKQDYVDTKKVQMIKTGQAVVVGGDTVLASGGVSIWTPISAINPETPGIKPMPSLPGSTSWFVMLGSFNANNGDLAVKSANRVKNKASNECHVSARTELTAKMEGFTPGFVSAFLGPYDTQEGAAADKERVLPCVPDSYIKSVTR